MVLARMNRQAEAVGYFRKVIALDPKSPGSHMNLGIALADQFDLEGALAEFSEAVRLDPNAAAAHYNKGRVLLDLRRNSDAKPELEIATRLDPRVLRVLVFTRPDREDRRAMPRRQFRCCKRQRRSTPGTPIPCSCWDRSCCTSGDRDGAIAQWRKVIEIKPDHGEALYNLSRQLAKSDPQEAQQFQAAL